MSKDDNRTAGQILADKMAATPYQQLVGRISTRLAGTEPNPNDQFNYNFNVKLYIGRVLIVEFKLAIPHTQMAEAWHTYKKKSFPDIPLRDCANAGLQLEVYDTNERIERATQEFMFSLEQAFNGIGMYRCHVEQLPSDIPAGVVLEKEEVL